MRSEAGGLVSAGCRGLDHPVPARDGVTDAACALLPLTADVPPCRTKAYQRLQDRMSQAARRFGADRIRARDRVRRAAPSRVSIIAPSFQTGHGRRSIRQETSSLRQGTAGPATRHRAGQPRSPSRPGPPRSSRPSSAVAAASAPASCSASRGAARRRRPQPPQPDGRCAGGPTPPCFTQRREGLVPRFLPVRFDLARSRGGRSRWNSCSARFRACALWLQSTNFSL